MSLSDSDSDFELLQQLSDWDTDSEDEYEVNPREYKSRNDCMNMLNDYEFTYRFRLSKRAVSELLLEIHPFLRTTSARNHGIPPIHQLLLTLRFYALGTMLVSVADFIGVSKSSAGRIVENVSAAIAALYPKYIYIKDNTQQPFYNIAGFPRVLGAVDCTHISIQSPDSSIGEEFRNRKGYYSLNVQCVCDANLLFMNVVARWPGSSHDATIFNNTELRAQCESGVYGNRWLIGDSGYGCKSYLLTPVLEITTHNEELYNKSHVQTRNPIERTFGVWKRRFPVLSLKIRLSLPTTQAIIIATAVLHNICRELNLDEVEPEIEMPEYVSVTTPLLDQNENYEERNNLITNYFTTRTPPGCRR